MEFRLKKQEVEFQETNEGGELVVIGRLTVHQWVVADEIARQQMEEEAEAANMIELATAKEEGRELTKREIEYQHHRANIYPKLAACSTGDVPDEKTAFIMPGDMFLAWFKAAKEINPTWFVSFDEYAEAQKMGRAAFMDFIKKNEEKPPE